MDDVRGMTEKQQAIIEPFLAETPRREERTEVTKVRGRAGEK
jgi:hypothetical protein